MRILFVCALSIGALSMTGCVNTENLSDPVTDTLARTPLMYKPDIQQGNVISQEQVNRLEPGMTRQQVRYLMGTPMLVDTFHQNRWDYVFTMKKGGEQIEKRRVALYFKDDRLVRIEGDFRPQPNSEPVAKDIVVTVPDYKARKKGFMDRTLQAVGLTKESATEQMQDKADEQIKANEGNTEEAVDNTEQAAEEVKAEVKAIEESSSKVEEVAEDNTDPTALPEPEKAN